MINGIIVGHQDIGDALLRALKSISGTVENINYISNNGLSTREVAERIQSIHESMNGEPVILFVDIFGGSCWRAAKLAKLPNCHIITGLNLPMLLSFINKRELYSFDEITAILELDGKRGITAE